MNSVFAHGIVWLILIGWSSGPSDLLAQTKTDEVSNPEIPNADESQTGIPAGHSIHGEAFNEGPRQKAYLMDGTGKINFDVTTTIPEAADFVRQGMGQLYGYWYLEAERSFRQAAMLDPDCAIAYWGMARANDKNDKRAKSFIEEAVKRKSSAGKLEGMMIDAWNAYLNSKSKKQADKTKPYFAALEAMAKEFPDNLEVKAERAFAMYRYRTDLKLSYDDANNALNEVLAIEPLHPVHHFRIHLWDYKDSAKALNSAAKCGAAAPGIAHMWHMPGHIYSREKRYSDAVWQQEASARVDHAHMMRDRVMPDQIHNFAHNNEWLIRNMGHIGRWRDAVDLAMNMTELPRHPKYNTFDKKGSAYYGRLRLFDELFRFEQWELLASLSRQPYLEPTEKADEQLKRLRYLGIAVARLGDDKQVEAILTQFDERLKKAEKQQQKNEAEAKKKADEQLKKAQDEAEKRRLKAEKDRVPEAPPLPEGPPTPPKAKPDPRVPVQQAIAAVKGHQAFAKNQFEEAVAQLKKADGDGLLLAAAQSQAGKSEDAMKTLESYLKTREKRVQPLAGKIEILWRAEKKDDARKSFDELREIPGDIQFGSPVFDRLSPIAKELGYSEDWRIRKERPDDFGERPELDSLGPFRWQPMPAVDWTLNDTNGKAYSLAGYQGKPVVVIFYLGYGCLHCAEQLQKFAPMAKQYTDAGIELIGISTDSQKDLKQSIDNYKGGMPFPLVSDAKLDIFKAWRAYDDFEQKPLHGTFLIDGSGLVRWQDISHEPFMDPEFLLKESQRLLAQDGKATRQILNVDQKLATSKQ
ncbi:MAG: redoxin domain-containing protein [Rhodopirellula sp.]|nr:redoxin domain-containing protein [Rhodopirellula sp.]